MENSNQINEENLKNKERIVLKESLETEEHTPKLFSDEHIEEDANQDEPKDVDHTEQMFSQENHEDEDFEIPAFLRRQKF